jgi:hypothetical protein
MDPFGLEAFSSPATIVQYKTVGVPAIIQFKQKLNEKCLNGNL